MLGKKGNSLIVIENGKLTDYRLDDKLVWEVGRPSRDNNPDIILHSVTVSRQHGKFQNIDGMWFYLDKKGKTNKKLKRNPMALKYLTAHGKELKEAGEKIFKENFKKGRRHTSIEN